MANFKEKRRLRRIVRSILPPGFGVIVRTVAQDKEEAAIKADLESLIETWREIEKHLKTEKPPAILYKDMATTSSVIRDLFTDAVERVVVDSKKLYKEITAYVKMNTPDLLDKIEFYKDREPIFDSLGIEKEIATCLSRKVWMKSGGYIIIEQTEAMAVIDVNSGRYAAKREQELNSLRTNLEAAREVSRQVRLRDLGGIIVIDFIDLEDERNRKKVYDELRKEFRRDRAKVSAPQRTCRFSSRCTFTAWALPRRKTSTPSVSSSRVSRKSNSNPRETAKISWRAWPTAMAGTSLIGCAAPTADGGRSRASRTASSRNSRR